MYFPFFSLRHGAKDPLLSRRRLIQSFPIYYRFAQGGHADQVIPD